MGVLMLPVVILLLCSLMLFGIVGNAIRNVADGGIISYNEKVFQEYTDMQYQEAFGDSSATEDNLMIVFLANEDADHYYAIAWIGDNVCDEINLMFGAEGTEFYYAMTSNVDEEYYAYSIDKDLAMTVNRMTEKVKALGLESSFEYQKDHSNMTASHVVNRSELSITEETVNTALEEFTKETDIPVVLVVDTMENVFGKTLPTSTILTLIVLAVVIIAAIVSIFKAIRNRKKDDDGYGERQ